MTAYVSVTLDLVCKDCSKREKFTEVGSAWLTGAHRLALKAGWRCDSTIKEAWCGKCGRKRFPYLYEKEYQDLDERVYASYNHPPRKVRRLRPEDRKPPKKMPRKLGVRRS